MGIYGTGKKRCQKNCGFSLGKNTCWSIFLLMGVDGMYQLKCDAIVVVVMMPVDLTNTSSEHYHFLRIQRLKDCEFFAEIARLITLRTIITNFFI